MSNRNRIVMLVATLIVVGLAVAGVARVEALEAQVAGLEARLSRMEGAASAPVVRESSMSGTPTRRGSGQVPPGDSFQFNGMTFYHMPAMTRP